jgi:hypothetical protein
MSHLKQLRLAHAEIAAKILERRAGSRSAQRPDQLPVEPPWIVDEAHQRLCWAQCFERPADERSGPQRRFQFVRYDHARQLSLETEHHPERGGQALRACELLQETRRDPLPQQKRGIDQPPRVAEALAHRLV